MNRAAKYYEQKLGFKIVFLYGDPPFYGQVGRGGARLNFRFVRNLPFNEIERRAEQLLSAYIPVRDVKAWFWSSRNEELISCKPSNRNHGGLRIS